MGLKDRVGQTGEYGFWISMGIIAIFYLILFACPANALERELDINHPAHVQCAKEADGGAPSGRMLTDQEVAKYQACIERRWSGLLGGTSVRAFSHSIWSSDESRDDQLDRLRFRMDHQFGGRSWGFAFEVDAFHDDWAHEFTLWRQVSPYSRLLAGKVFTGATGTDSAPLDRIPVFYQRSTRFAAYAYGLQLERKHVDDNGKQVGYLIIVDVTGSSGLPFDDTNALDFSEPEMSFRLRSEPGRWQYLVSGQIGGDFTRLASWVKWQPLSDELLLWGGLYFTDEDLVDRNKLAPVLLAEWRTTEVVRPFVEIEKPGGSIEGQLGLNLYPTNWLRVATQYYTGPSSENNDGFSLLVQLHHRQ